MNEVGSTSRGAGASGQAAATPAFALQAAQHGSRKPGAAAQEQVQAQPAVLGRNFQAKEHKRSFHQADKAARGRGCAHRIRGGRARQREKRESPGAQAQKLHKVAENLQKA